MKTHQVGLGLNIGVQTWKAYCKIDVQWIKSHGHSYRLLVNSWFADRRRNECDEMIGDELIGDELIGDEMIGDEMIGDEMILRRNECDEMNATKWSATKWAATKGSDNFAFFMYWSVIRENAAGRSRKAQCSWGFAISLGAAKLRLTT